MQRDVDPRRQAKQDEWLRSLSDAERASMVARLWRSGRRISEINVRNRYPDATAGQVHWRVVELLYGRNTAERLLGAMPP